MSIKSWPFHNGTDGTPVYEDQWSIMSRQWASSGVVPRTVDDLYPLAEFRVSANGSGREVHVRPGRACVRGHWVESDSQVTLPVAANTTGSLRYDLVVLRLDPSTDGVTLTVKQGTGSPPAATQTDLGVWELPLAMVAVNNGASTLGVGEVADMREYVSIPVQPCYSFRRPAEGQPGQLAVEMDTSTLVMQDAYGQWVIPKATPYESWATVPTVGAPGATQPTVEPAKLKVWRAGDVVHLKGRVSGLANPPGGWPITGAGALPAPAVNRYFPVIQQGSGAPNAVIGRVTIDGQLFVDLPGTGVGVSVHCYFDGASYCVA